MAWLQSASERTSMGPRRLDLKLGFACNNRCVFCAQGHKRQGCAHLPLQELLGRLAQARASHSELVLTGGEPTLHPQLLELVKGAKALGYEQIQLQTNGRRLAYGAFIDALIRAGVSEFSPALHGPSADVHDALTCSPGSFSQTVAGLRNLAARGVRVVTNSVVVRSNTAHLAELVLFLAQLGVTQAQLAYVHPVGTAWERFEEVVPRPSQLRAALAQCCGLASRLGLRLVTEAVPLCFLSGHFELAVEQHIPDTTVIDQDGRPLNYSRWRPDQGKAHGPVCERCSVRLRCEGPWREVTERFGWDEFQALP